MRTDGVGILDVPSTLESGDGALIYIAYTGVGDLGRFFGSYFAFTDFMIDDEAEGRVQATYVNIRRRRPESNGLAAAYRLPSVSSMIRRFV